MEKNQAAVPVAKSLQVALQRLLRPLVRLLIARSIPFPSLSDLIRGVYVDVAVKEFPVAGKPQTDSRITLLTGVHRKDVKRLRNQHHSSSRAPRAASLGSQLIAHWTSLPEYLDEQGTPKPLPRLPSKEGEPSFESLVRSLNTDIRPRVVLDEWLRLKFVEVDAQDCVRLNVQAFVPPQGTDEMTYYFGRNLHDHTAAAVHNMLTDLEPLLERSVSYNNLTREAVAELNQLARQRAMQVLQEINARALRLQQAHSGTPEASQRMSFGVYFLSEDESTSDDKEPGNES